jgi:hypothetical protein
MAALLAGIFTGGITLAAITGAAFTYGVLYLDVDSARTLALVAWLVGHAVLGIVMAWERRPASIRGLAGNQLLLVWAGTAWFAAGIALVEPVGAALHAAPIAPLLLWQAAIFAAVVPLWLEVLKSERRA